MPSYIYKRKMFNSNEWRAFMFLWRRGELLIYLLYNARYTHWKKKLLNNNKKI